MPRAEKKSGVSFGVNIAEKLCRQGIGNTGKKRAKGY
jgi:hypothetical protein